jgi:5'-3' exonuclease
MDVHLVDGTYELFRHYHALPSMRDASGREVAAVRGVLGSMLSLLRGGATHVGVATDHVVESFRNELWPGYKTGRGVPEDLLAQFPVLEEALQVMGIVVWPMVELEADDALAAAAQRAAADRRVGRVYICTPDKDLSQCVVGERVVQLDRRTGRVRDAAGVEARFGVPPAAIPEYLALVGDSADGFPGVPGWGPKSAAAVLQHYPRLEAIPKTAARWHVDLRNAARLAANLAAHWDEALLFRKLATLRTDVDLFGAVSDLRWRGPQPGFRKLGADLGDSGLWERAAADAARRG